MIKIDKSFDLEKTVFSGECFRMSKIEDAIILIIDDRVLKIKKVKDKYYIYSNNENNLKEKVYEYFDLVRDYERINDSIIKNDPSLKEIVKASKGYKILKQNNFEMFISYIISQNNNVKRISYSINKLSEMYGKKIIYENNEYYLFPTYAELKNITMEDLKLCKVGFRDKYIINALNVIKEDNFFLTRLETLDTDNAYKELMNIKGIGPKVASCILMFGYGRFNAFPIDTWAKKFLMNKYNIHNIKELQKELHTKYKENVGLVIQYMFNYERNIKVN